MTSSEYVTDTAVFTDMTGGMEGNHQSTVDLHDPDAREFKGKLIHQAAIYFNTSLLVDLLQGPQRRFINERDSFGRTALHAVCAAEIMERDESIECVRLLLEAGADPNISAGDKYQNYTPLHIAAKDGKIEIARYLVQYGGDVDTKDIKRLSPLELARANFQSEIVDFIKIKKVERERLRAELEPDLIEACTDVTQLRGILRRIGFNAINGEYKETPLFRAAQAGQRQVVQYLIDHGANGRPNRDTKETALYTACYHGRLEIAQLLLQRFPEMASIQTQEMEIPLHAAAKQGHSDLVRLLLEFDYKAIMDDKQSLVGEAQARTGQHFWNEFKEQTGLVDTDQSTNGSPFKAYKGDLPYYINQRNINGQTPLYLACTAGHTEVVRTLLEFRPRGSQNGPNFTKKQSYVEVDCYTVLGRTPLHSAVQSGNVEIVGLLLKNGADVNLPIKSIQCLFNPRNDQSESREGRVVEQMHIPRQDNSLLYEACSVEYYNLEVIAMLLRHGARDSNGKALLSAMLSMRHDVITTILAHTGVHPDPDYHIGDTYKGLFKMFLLDHYGPELFDGGMKQGKSFRFMSKQETQTHHHKKGSIVRRKTLLGITRTMSTQGAFDTPVAIDWHDQNLIDIKLNWLVEAGFRYNPALRPYPLPESEIHVVMATVTRIDVSDNSLGSLPFNLFQLPSLQLLNVSKNKIMHLPCEDNGSPSSMTRHGSRDSDSSSTTWHAPLLKRLDVSHNWLQNLPSGLFFLPALESLDAQSNDIKSLPFEMWMAPKLKVANFSRNYLEDLPGCPFGSLSDAPPVFNDPDEVNSDEWEVLTHKRLPRSNTLQTGNSDKMSTKIADFSRAAAIRLGIPYFGAKDATTETSTLGSNATYAEDVRLSQATTQTSADSIDSDSDMELEGIQRRFSITNFRRHRLGSSNSVRVTDIVEESANVDDFGSLETLDLSHNRLQRVPVGLPCLAPKLTKLTLSYNQITEFGPMIKYPAGLMDLEMSHNKIKHLATPSHRLSLRGRAGMFKLLRSSSYQDSGNLEVCFSPASQLTQPRKLSLGPLQSPREVTREAASFSFSGQSTSGQPQACKHRRHRVLANLRTLDLSNNKLMELEVIIRSNLASNSEDESELSDDSLTQEIVPRSGDTSPKSPLAAQKKSDSEVTLLFPSITMLAVSNNQISEVPADIQYLTRLSSLKIDGNDRITTLPPEMGRLKGVLYDINPEGCRLMEPLASLSKTSANDLLGYLRSVLDDAKPYTRMKLMLVGKAGIGKTTLLNELRKEGVGSFATQLPEHFLERQDYFQSGGKTTLKGTNLSTVGVDVGDWTFQKRKGRHGKVTFSTWDFGGQEEFYATHQYFLTKRSLYLVMFNITEWKTAITELQQWLVNIQARAPNSPVIIVGTHHDIILRERNKYSKDYWPELKRIICDRFMYIPQPQEVGLPDVKDVVEISCLPGHRTVTQLRDQIYDVAFSLTEGRDKEPFLMKRVPTSYLALEKAIANIMQLKKRGREEPVLRATEYKTEVTRVMIEQSNVSFHDKEELMQATRFLHNNGILLHYEDSLLSDYFFLDPQWLCDMLAKVVTIAEINPEVKKGVMRIQDLHRKFQDSSVKDFILSLLNKFEVAVTYDQDHLLIPSRLPREGKEPTVIPMNRERGLQPQVTTNGSSRPTSPSDAAGYADRRRALRNPNPNSSPKDSRPQSPSSGDESCGSISPDIIKCVDMVPAERSKVVAVHSRSAPSSARHPQDYSKNLAFSPKDLFRGPAPEGTMSFIDLTKRKAATLEKEKSTSASSLVLYKDKEKVEISLLGPQGTVEEPPGLFDDLEIQVTDKPKSVIRRLYILQYIPSGFWSHLISRFLSDHTVMKVVNSLYLLPQEMKDNLGEDEIGELKKEFKWVSWQTGIELKFFSSTVFYLKEIVHESRLCYEFSRERRPDVVQVISPSGEEERSVDLSRSGQMEIVIPNQSLTINKEPKCLIMDEATNKLDSLEFKDVKIEPSTEVASRLLAVIVDLIDALVENFYPSLSEVLGTTFEGELFITRVVPCVRCWVDYNKPNWDDVDVTDWEIVNPADIESDGRDMIPSRACAEEMQEPNGLCCSPVSCSKALLDISSDLTPLHRRRAYNVNRNGKYTSVFHVSRPRNSRAESSDGEVTLNGGRKRHKVKTQLSNEIQSLVDEGEGRLDTSDCISMEMSNEMIDGDYQVYGFLFEELVLQAMRDGMVTCPNHGRIKLSTIAPDVMFHDLSSPRDLLTDKSHLEIQRLLGSGTFGLVFQGVYVMVDHKKHNVAFKMLQPFPPGQGAGNTDRRRYDIENNKWQVDPVRFSCEAYRKARMELSIILNLDHPHIVPLLGFCHQPMCLILELAPAGALDGKLENYKRVGARLTPRTLQEIIVQVASAVAYLHSKDIIYRDLKAENVLVWEVPDPFSHANYNTVKVKLADYGISVSALPSGTKGYGGTPGYMAPEIVVYDGKETYTEKVDCFSFAMFMYELLSLQRPFEGVIGKDVGRLSEVIKQLIKDGQRPLLNKKEKSYPTYILDLMAWCWAQDPRERPSMNQISDIARTAEFASLREVLSPESNAEVTCTCVTTGNGNIPDSDSEDMSGFTPTVWLAQNDHSETSTVIIINPDRNPNEDTVCIRLKVGGGAVQCMCAVGDVMWLGMANGGIAIYGTDRHCYQDMRQPVHFPQSLGKSHIIRQMTYIAPLQKVFIACDDRIWVISEHEGVPYGEEWSFKCIDLGREVHSMTTVLKRGEDGSKIYELWCGQVGGFLTIIDPSTLAMKETDINHGVEAHPLNRVTQLVTYDPDVIDDGYSQYVWSYVAPGAYVYKWNTETMTIEDGLDVGAAIAECRSNSRPKGRQSLRRMGAFKPGQVSTMSLMENYLYIGVTSGNLLVMEALTLSPLIAISCHEGPVKNLITLATEPFIPAHATLRSTENTDQSESIMNHGSTVALMTVGPGFNDLLNGYPNSPSRFKGHADAHGWCILLWNATQWEQAVTTGNVATVEEEVGDEEDILEDGEENVEEMLEREEDDESNESFKSFSSRSSTDL